jgi:diguanylate cyclase (GGDEF)-like protein
MPKLDPFTLKAMALATVYAVSISSLIAWRINRQVPGLRQFTIGLFFVATGGTLGLAHLLVPGANLMLACIICIVVGVVLLDQAIREFRGFSTLPLLWLAGFLIAAAMLAYRMIGIGNLSIRVGVVSSAISILAMDAAASMFRRVTVEDRTIYWPTGFAFAFTALLYATRAAGGFYGAYGDGVFTSVPLETFSTICVNIALIGCMVGMLLASNAQLHQEAQKLALFDPLTNLPNRRYFLERLSQTERQCLLNGTRFGVLFLDLDDFKGINDTLGHAAGDEILHGVSAAMSAVLRAGDCLARIGGDEFVVIAEHVARDADMAILSERLRTAAEAYSVPNDSTLLIRISCGSAIFPDDGNSAESVMRQADDAMYRDKGLSQQLTRVPIPIEA